MLQSLRRRQGPSRRRACRRPAHAAAAAAPRGRSHSVCHRHGAARRRFARGACHANAESDTRLQERCCELLCCSGVARSGTPCGGPCVQRRRGSGAVGSSTRRAPVLASDPPPFPCCLLRAMTPTSNDISWRLRYAGGLGTGGGGLARGPWSHGRRAPGPPLLPAPQGGSGASVV